MKKSKNLTTKTTINSIEELVKKACFNKSNIFGPGIWDYHVAYVVKYSKKLATILDANKEIVEIAALLHDYAGIKNPDYIKEHHTWGAKEADIILSSFNYPKEKIEKIKQCILSHRGSIVIKKNSPEEVCLTSADAMAHIDQVVSLLYAIFKERNFSIKDGKTWVREKLKRSWKKLCPEAKKIMSYKYKCALELLK